MDFTIREEENGLLVFGENNCLGYLFCCPEHGVFDAAYGRVDVTPESAKRHNAIFDQMVVTALDKREIGEGEVLYVNKAGEVITWAGTVVGEARDFGDCYFLERNGHEFEGEKDDECESVFFRRVK